MSLDKAILHGKEHREPFTRDRKKTRSKAVSISCRHGGSCNRCLRDRQIAKLKLDQVDKLIKNEGENEEVV